MTEEVKTLFNHKNMCSGLSLEVSCKNKQNKHNGYKDPEQQMNISQQVTANIVSGVTNNHVINKCSDTSKIMSINIK